METIQVQDVLAFFGFIVLFGNVCAVVNKFVRPALHIKEQVEVHADEIESLKAHEKDDLERLNKLQDISKVQCNMMLCMINHMIDGNGIERMKETREEVQDFLCKL